MRGRGWTCVGGRECTCVGGDGEEGVRKNREGYVNEIS